eukprot:g7474.t1
MHLRLRVVLRLLLAALLGCSWVLMRAWSGTRTWSGNTEADANVERHAIAFVLKTGRGRPHAQWALDTWLAGRPEPVTVVSDGADELRRGNRAVQVFDVVHAAASDPEGAALRAFLGGDAWRGYARRSAVLRGKQGSGYMLDRFKFVPALLLSYRRFPASDWHYLVDDDAMVFVPRLLRALEALDPDDAHYFGAPASLGFDAGAGGGSGGRMLYAEGGSGVVVSRAAVRALAARFLRPRDALTQPGVLFGDTFLAVALRMAGVGFDAADVPLGCRFRQRDGLLLGDGRRAAPAAGDALHRLACGLGVEPVGLCARHRRGLAVAVHPVRSQAEFSGLLARAQQCGSGHA